MIRIYNTTQRNILKDKLKDNKYMSIHKELFIILKNDDNFKYTKNCNGIYFNINFLADITIKKVNILLNSLKNEDVKPNLKYNDKYFIEEYSNTKKERHHLKRR